MPEDGSFANDLRTGLQRVSGRAAVSLVRRSGRSGLVGLYQSGSAKAFLPRVHGPVPEIVYLNTAGGLTGGDRLGFELELGAGVAAVGTTQTAERAYRTMRGRARMEVRLSLAEGARLDWLPQETILFEASTLARRTLVDLAPGAELLMAETVVLGRAAMGETVQDLLFTDWREVRRNGRPLLVEPLRITAGTLTAGAAALGGARAFATILLFRLGAEDLLPAVRACLADDVEAAASAWDGRLVVRLIGPGLLPVKWAVARVLDRLRGAPLPRVWQL